MLLLTQKVEKRNEAQRTAALAACSLPLKTAPPSPVTPALASYSLSWQAPSAWEDAVLLGEELQHAVEVAGQQILTANFCHAWEVVYFLK